MKVLLILDHAPDYREKFLRELGRYANLTVAAQPCEPDGLAPPDCRAGYEYYDLPSRRFAGFYWQPGLSKMLCYKQWDVVCCDFNLRHLTRLYNFFLRRKQFENNWIWRGLIFGSNDNSVLNFFRKFFLQRAVSCLVYSDEVAEKVKHKLGADAVSFNNTEVRRDDFRIGVFNKHDEIRLLFVGTYKPRKKINRLIQIAQRRNDISVRIIGPGMNSLDIPAEMENSDRLQIIGRTTGKALNSHFDWADIVASPGNVGLLVMHAAKHGKGIVVDNNSYHGPEHWLAKKTDQPFISFGSKEEVDQFIDDVLDNRWKLKQWGRQLQEVAKQKYTIEYMAEAHYRVFKKVARGCSRRRTEG